MNFYTLKREYFTIFLISYLAFFCPCFFIGVYAEEKPLVVVIPSYNNSQWYQKNLDSVFNQHYENYRVIYIDDCSSDSTYELIKTFIEKRGQEDKVKLIKNKIRRGALANHYHAVHLCEDYEIIVNLDGDDWFKHDYVFAKINEIYQNSNIWLTYGQFELYPSNELGCCQEIPWRIIKDNGYREYKWTTSALRTFYAALFKRIKLEDLLYKGTFFPVGCDIAFMFPMLEMAGGHSIFIPDILYVYNCESPCNDAKQNPQLQVHITNIIRGKDKYKPLEHAPFAPPFKEKKYKADIVVFSYDNPLQLFALLESLYGSISGIGNIYIVYQASNDAFVQAYKKMTEDFSDLIFICQSKKENFDLKTLLLEYVFPSKNKFILFAQDSLVVKDFVNLNHCIRLMKQTYAYAFFLCLGNNIIESSFLVQNQRIPACVEMQEGVYAWQFKYGECDWKTPHNIYMTLYRKADLLNYLLQSNYNSIQMLEFWNKYIFDMNRIGLFFKDSRVVDVRPKINHNNYQNKNELLTYFNNGLKIDILPLFKVDNRSITIEHELKLKPR